MAFIIFKYFIRLIRYRSDPRYCEYFGDVFVQVFILVILWLISKFLSKVGSIVRVSLNIGTYYTYMAPDFNTSPLLNTIQ